MRIYWYWPNAHATVNKLALATLRPGDSLTVQALSALHGKPFGPIEEYEVIRDLPDPRGDRSNLSRVLPRGLYNQIGRSQARRRFIARGLERADIAHLEHLVYRTDWLDVPTLARHLPLVSMVHDVRPHRRTLPPRVEYGMLRRLYQHAGHLVVYHRVLRDELLNDFPIEPERVHVIPHPLDATSRRDLQRSVPDTPYLLFFGTLRPNKGIDVLLQAYELARGQGFDLVVAGGGDRDLETTLRKAGTGRQDLRIEIGRIPEERKHALMSSASALVLPYTSFHSQSGVLADAYSYRLPIVVTDVGALGPTVRDDGTGLVVPPNDAEAFAAAMSSVVLDPDPAWPHRIDAAAQQHDVSSVGPKLRQIYDVATA